MGSIHLFIARKPIALLILSVSALSIGSLLIHDHTVAAKWKKKAERIRSEYVMDSEVKFVIKVRGEMPEIYEEKEEYVSSITNRILCRNEKAELVETIEYRSGKTRETFREPVPLGKYLGLWAQLQWYDIWELNTLKGPKARTRKNGRIYLWDHSADTHIYVYYVRRGTMEHEYEVFATEGLDDDRYHKIEEIILGAIKIEIKD